jgi:hypothetical protein
MSTQRQASGLRGLLLIMVLGLVFLLGVAIGQAHADMPQEAVTAAEALLEQEAPPRFQTEVIAERACLELQVRPRIMLPLSRGDIRIELRIARHAHHRQFSVAWDGGFAGAGGSAQSLHGEDEPFLHVREVKNQPAAPWHVVAAVFDTKGKLLRRKTADILMPDGGTP